MTELLIVAFLILYFTALNHQSTRQFFDDEHPCLSDDSGCDDDGHIFKDDEIIDDVNPPWLPPELYDAPAPNDDDNRWEA